MVELKANGGFAVVGKRLGLAFDAYLASVHAHSQQWLHEHIGAAGQIGEEGNAQLQLFDAVLGLRHLIVELDVAVMHADIGASVEF